MNNTLKRLLAMILILILTAGIASAETYSAIVSANKMPVYSSDDLFEPLGSLAKNTLVTILDSEDGVAKLTDRSAFAGSIATADRLVRNMLRAGVSLPEAVEMVTVNPLRMMDLQVQKGRLRPGFDGDVCVFDGDIQVKKVFCGGVLAVEHG